VSNIGGALLRAIAEASRKSSDETNPYTIEDALQIIDEMMSSAAFRGRAASLANLSQELPLEARKLSCRAHLIIMYSKREPPPITDPDYSKFVTATSECSALAAPHHNSSWASHVEISRKKSGRAEYMRISPYLAEIIRGFEDLYGVSGALVSRV